MFTHSQGAERPWFWESEYEKAPPWARGDLQSLSSCGPHLFVTDGKKHPLDEGRDDPQPASVWLLLPGICRRFFNFFFLLQAKWVPQISFLKGMSLSDRALPPVARCEMNLAVHRAQLPHVEFLVLAKFPLKLRYSNKSQSWVMGLCLVGAAFNCSFRNCGKAELMPYVF